MPTGMMPPAPQVPNTLDATIYKDSTRSAGCIKSTLWNIFRTPMIETPIAIGTDSLAMKSAVVHNYVHHPNRKNYSDSSARLFTGKEKRS